LAFLTKETIILAAIPLFFCGADKKHRVFVIITGAGFILSRVLLQWFTAVPGKYTSLVDVSDFFFYKLYFIMLRTLGISPYSLNPILGIAILIILILSGGYFAVFKRNRSFLFFFLFFTLFTLFFSLLPKLTSRYFFYPAFGFWGMAALWFHYFYEKNKKVKYALCLLPIILFFNYVLIKKEIVDYKILGDFSQQFIQQQASIIKSNFKTGEMMIYKTNFQPLANVYQQIKDRGNMKKLLPFRENGIGGVIEPAHLVPIAFYPQKTIRWYQIKETPGYFGGELNVISQ
ncbi:MAG: hypothetical protein MUF15_22175, partial [Acidobacteria bacterium]|nr:hypothetical protein [Acidobacteriota bacterium]